MSSFLYDTETWGALTCKEMKSLEKFQKEIAQKFLGQSKAMLFWGMLIETGTWPVENRTDHSRLAFYHNLTHSVEERDTRKVIIEMIQVH